MFNAVLILPVGREDRQTNGDGAAMKAFFEQMDWALAAEGTDEYGRMAAIEVRRESNGDMLAIEFDPDTDLFQCYANVVVPKKVFGISSYLFDGGWESPPVMLSADDVSAAIDAFCTQDIPGLRAFWDKG